MLPLLHFSRPRVAVSSSSAPAFGAFAPGSSCHLRYHHLRLFRRCLAYRFSSRLYAILGLIATPSSFTTALTVARPSRSAARLPSCQRAPRFNLTSALSRDLSRASLHPHGSDVGHGPCHFTQEATPASFWADAPLRSFFTAYRPSRLAFALALEPSQFRLSVRHHTLPLYRNAGIATRIM
jgi:hypothetical protein